MERTFEYLEESLIPKFTLSEIEKYVVEHPIFASPNFIHDYWANKGWKTNSDRLIIECDISVACNVANSMYCKSFRGVYGWNKYNKIRAEIGNKNRYVLDEAMLDKYDEIIYRRFRINKNH